ncbi:MAG: acetolactate synthase small subunit [Proteobacteria bacterium]|nr:acetolactate synthase small subunit [Pseudomonadota bacterium]
MYDTIIELSVRNHPGVMSHITGLFSRRAFNLEGIVCGPVGDGTQSRMILLVNKNHRLDQMIKQLEKLYDVLAVSVREDPDRVHYQWLYEQG